MKKTRPLAACLATIAACLVAIAASDRVPGPAAQAPAENATLSIGSAEVEAGASTTVPLSVSLGGYVLGAATVDIQYDPDVVHAVGCTPDPDGLFAMKGCNIDRAPDTVRFWAIAPYGVTGNPVLAEITFQALGQAGDVSPLDLAPVEFNNTSGQPIPVSVVNGEILIVAGGGLPAPSGLVATAVSPSEIDLSWIDNSTDETAFHVERSPDGSADWAEIATVAAGVTSFEDTGLACGSDYYYRVRAYRGGDGLYSGYSNTAGDTTGDCAGDSLLRIGSALIEEGETTSVLLSAALAGNLLGAVTVEIQYDPGVVDAVECFSDPDGVLDWAECNVDYGTDTVAFSALALAGVAGNPVLARMTFQAVGAAGQSSPLLLTPTVFVDPAGDPISVSVENGTITVWLPTDRLHLPVALWGYP